jgi:type I restriction enzyme, S subunit
MKPSPKDRARYLKTPVMASWLWEQGYRLDAPPFLSGAVEARKLIDSLHLRKDKLKMLTKGFNGGIYNGPQFSRTYVDDPEYGVPFLGSTDMLEADLSRLPLLSKKKAYSSKLSYLEVKEGMILISCSGTIGRMGFVRPDMVGMWSSQHVMKVVPDPEKIPPGYLYAFLSSKFGVPLITGGTYGAIIQHIEPHHISNIEIPRLGETEKEIDILITSAANLRSNASNEINLAVNNLLRELNLNQLKVRSASKFGISIIQYSQLDNRLDATYHAKIAREIEVLLRKTGHPIRKLTDVTKKLFKPPIFKRLWVDDEAHGKLFISGQDAYKIKSENKRFVSFRTPKFNDFIIKYGWVVFQAAGQVYGLFGQPLFVSGWIENSFCADDMYRIVPHDVKDGAYLYAFFRTSYGQILLKRQASGESIPRIWDPQMSKIVVPWLDESIRRKIGQQIIDAHEKYREALQLEEAAMRIIENAIEGAS